MMKEIMQEKIVQLGIAQQSMVETVDIMNQLDESKNLIEKSAYESMNATDTAKNLSVEGINIIKQLKSLCYNHDHNPQEADHQNIDQLIEQLSIIISGIKDAATKEVTTIHIIEKEVEYHGELTKKLQQHLDILNDSIGQAAACAEFTLTMDL